MQMPVLGPGSIPGGRVRKLFRGRLSTAEEHVTHAFAGGQCGGCIWEKALSSPAGQFADLLIDPGADGHDVPGDAQNEAE